MKVVYPTLRTLAAGFGRGFRSAGDRLGHLARKAPRIFAAGLIAVSVLFWLVLGGVAWFTYDVTRTIPGLNELRGLGNMSQATVLYDRNDRPAFTIFRRGRVWQGASTITQQLARLSFPERISLRDQSYTRKLKEAILAALI